MPSALPFFMPSGAGERFCLYHAPDPQQPARGAILYAHPFAEELNKTRRMAALQARAFADAGYGVLLIDLLGCGDSSGDFGDARWSLWLDDLDSAWGWLRRRVPGPATLWGLRLGALLALALSVRLARAPDRLLLWQPVVSGNAHLNQFLRMQSAARLFSDPGRAAPAAALAAQPHPLEVAGYTLAPDLIAALRRADAAALTPPCPVTWMELATAPALATDAPALQAASALLIGDWRARGATVTTRVLRGPAFWASSEITQCAELLDATCALEPA